MKEIELEICRMFKHLGPERVEALPASNVAAYLLDLLHASGQGPEGGHGDVLACLEKTYRARRVLAVMLQQPQVAQRSPEWFALRKNRLTASDMAQALDKGKFGTKAELLVKKAFPDAAPPFSTSNPALQWGVMFEPMAARSYQQRHHDIVVHDFGLIPHPTMVCFGASPDGITDHGIMLEFKCPLRRRIDGTIPEQYAMQMQGQMAVCGLEECDYVECDMHRLGGRDEYLQIVAEHERRDHGIVLDFGEAAAGERYAYSPEYLSPSEAVAWMEVELRARSARVVYWRLRKIHICRVPFDAAWWDATAPKIEAFWAEVEDMRKNGNAPLSTEAFVPALKKKKFEFIIDEDDP
jgi:putative phage-type endonuclease